MIRLLAFGWSIYLFNRLRDWRVCFLSGMIFLMALRQILTAAKADHVWPLSFGAGIEELPGLVVSVLAILALIFLGRMLNDARTRAVELQRISKKLEQEIAVRDEAEAALQISESRLRRAAEMANLGYYVWDIVEDRCVYCSQEYARILGMSVDEYMRESAEMEIDLLIVHPEDREGYRQAFYSSLNELEPLKLEYRIVTKDGRVRHVREIEVKYDYENGRPVRSEGTIQDITAQVEAEERLHQAQKMEAVGQLTGGVAHDFNNLLAVIAGNAELLQDELGREVETLDPILRAARRGAELTQRLLAFSRQQSLHPEAIDLGVLVSGMSTLLTRALGETIDIEVRIAPDLWPAMADPGQVENALLNLAINARDAMPGGGKLTIECANARLDADYVADHPEVEAGGYAVLAVSDQGGGMTAKVRAHAFEPFFTTKAVGQGSGLGLSMIYGFAKQSGGHVNIYSEENRGTTVKLYLPRADRAANRADARSEEKVPRGKGELILVVEDDSDVRALAVTLLERLNYRVIDVADAQGARDVLANGHAVDLVLSDVVLPGGTSGPEFAEEARVTYPELKIIFMSGYPAEAAKRNGFLGSDSVLLNKPFQRRDLATALRQALTPN